MSTSGSLFVVGTGIQATGQLTIEASTAAKKAHKLFYLVTEEVADRYLRGLNPTAESLMDSYVPDGERLASYQAMVDRILAPVRQGLDVCVAFYGHPCVFVLPSRLAARMARAEGHYVRILPGVSAEDCLFADLGIDPATTGCSSYEATDFLLFGRRPDVTSMLVLWQPGVVGDLAHRPAGYGGEGIAVLADYLAGFYGPDHEVVVYEASVYSFFGPRVDRVPIRDLPAAGLTPISSLLVPPRRVAELDRNMLERLGLRDARLFEAQRSEVELVGSATRLS